MSIVITKAAEGLKLNEDGQISYLSQPTLKVNTGPVGLDSITLTASSGMVVKTILIKNITSIDGNPPAGTNEGIVDQITAILNSGVSTTAGKVPISADVLPLPTGASTAAKQDALATLVGVTNTNLDTLKTSAATLNTNVGDKADAAATSDSGTFSLLAFIKRALANWTTLLARIPALSNSRVPVESKAFNTSGGNVSVQTAAGGTTYTLFGSVACVELVVCNDTGTAIEIQQGGSGVGIPVASGAQLTIRGITNLNQLGVRRVDQGTTQVTLKARWHS